MNIEIFVIQLPILLFSVIVHEVFHGWVALKCGDDTALRMGRITLNPLPHLDMVGSVLLPAFAILSGAPVIGWAKPVPINPVLFNNPRRDTLVVAAAGPAANFGLAVLASIAFRFVAMFAGIDSAFKIDALDILKFVIIINVLLGIFNLMPIPPLDGSKILAYFLPRELAIKYENIGFFGIAIVFILLLSGVLGSVVFPAVKTLTSILLYGAL